MGSQQHAQAALNFSYVLHERSDSDTVRTYVRARDAERRKCSQAIRELTRLPDAELQRRLIVLDQTGTSASPEPNGVQIVSVDLGTGELFPRLLHVADIIRPGTLTFGSLLDGSSADHDRPLTFFGAPARLSRPIAPSDIRDRILFASAVLRPGYKSILLRVTSLAADSETGAPDWQHATQLAEAVIREFPLQWWCERALWSRPAEETLPEFRSTGNGTTACGH